MAVNSHPVGHSSFADTPGKDHNSFAPPANNALNAGTEVLRQSKTHRRTSSLVATSERRRSRFSLSDPSYDHREHHANSSSAHTTSSAIDDDDYGIEDEIAFDIDDEDPCSTNPAPVPLRLESTNTILLKKIAINATFILLWYTFSLSLSLYNKWMFSGGHLDFRFPLFATSMHMVTQTILAGVILFLVPRLRPKAEARMSWRVYLLHVGSCGVATGADIGLGNMSLRFITLGFYTMVKSSNLVFVLFFAFIFRLEKPTGQLISIIAMMTVGVIMMVASEAQFVAIGFILVLIAAILSGFRWSLTQILLKRNESTSNPFSTIFYLAPVMCVTLVLLAIPIEGLHNFLSAPIWQEESWFLWFLILVAPGVIAFLMTAAEFFLLHRTNVVTLSIVGIFKEVVTIGASAGIYGDKLTAVNVSGLIVALIAIALYNYIRIKNMKQKIMRQQINGSTSTVSLTDGKGDMESGTRPAYTALPTGREELEMQRLPPRSSSRASAAEELFDSAAEDSLFIRGKPKP
ncbi:triose-phosphate transporter family-domain-containing protein [Lipomyces orientalis]|uniref:Triose-phosphate transporter family-domain-containing protein n=1 Tax=Lipomyces orientalis TaxID=1233043 RepID=A0ACC3TUW8_9ASCO